jgi:hypothetical protein
VNLGFLFSMNFLYTLYFPMQLGLFAGHRKTVMTGSNSDSGYCWIWVPGALKIRAVSIEL